MPTASDIAHWLCMSPTCTKMNSVGDKSCKRCGAELAEGAKALSAGIDEIGEFEGMNSDGTPVWKLREPEAMDFSEARASTTYVRGYWARQYGGQAIQSQLIQTICIKYASREYICAGFYVLNRHDSVTVKYRAYIVTYMNNNSEQCR
ncbi:hypothetical protein FOFC_00303 [Fusarium oxysporum]|nr:hypothetical protein FOFC_00303 [Fusarium oxysporum]